MTADQATDLVTRPFGARLRAWVTLPEWRDAFRSLFALEPRELALGWPRILAGSDHEAWLRPSDVILELARSPARSPLELGLDLHAESATRLVDRSLGGRGSAALASAAGQPSEAECGVLAYAAARLCAAGASPWIVRDVRGWGSACAHAREPLLWWPLSMRTGDAHSAHDERGAKLPSHSEPAIEAALLFSLDLADCYQHHHELELIVRDSAPPDVLAGVHAGDVLVSDAWTLTYTSEGLAGGLALAVPGCESGWSARLAAGKVQALNPTGLPRTDQLEFVLHRRPLALRELAELARGAPLAVPAFAPGPVILRLAGQTLADCELVNWRGAVGFRISALWPRE